MPNQRSPKKHQTAFWLTDQERKDLEDAAKAAGMNMTDFVKLAIQNWIDEHEKKENDDDHRE